MKNKLILFVSISLLSPLFFAINANGATKPVVPKVGFCYNLTRADMDAPFSSIAPVNCSKTHTAEVYRIAKWTYSENILDITDTEKRLEFATALCQPWKGSSKYFNYWAWYTPDRKQWNAGQRWIRCDAMIAKNYDSETGEFDLVSWKNKRLDVR
jgi:hypothetical protein